MSTPERWGQQPKETVVCAHASHELDPLDPRYMQAEEIFVDILEDPAAPNGEDVRIILTDGSPW
ncbi:MAG: hypothetical protein ACLQPD_10490 [Desulfomonilaceae bacterium]